MSMSSWARVELRSRFDGNASRLGGGGNGDEFKVGGPKHMAEILGFRVGVKKRRMM